MSERDLREPEWSERERDRVEAMQPERSADIDPAADRTLRHLEERLEAQSRRLVELEVIVDDAVRLARIVNALDFDGHLHCTWAECDHCAAKRGALHILRWRRQCTENTPS
jgi:hypothetical protein